MTAGSSIVAFFGSSLRRFAADRRGAVAVFVAIAIIPLIGFIGIGTDTARAYLVKSRLSSALDSAGLAGGSSFFLPTRDDDMRMFFDANFPAGFMNSTVSDLEILVDEDQEKITLSASARIPTSFMALFGVDDLSVYAQAEVTRQMKALDVVLAIDMSGSMNWDAAGGGSRIAAARTAANELIDILYGANDTKELLSIGLVPWNSKVNVMTDGIAYDPLATTVDAVPAFTNPETGLVQNQVFRTNNSMVPFLAAPPPDWDGCVFSRYIDDATDATDGDIVLGMFSGGGVDWPAWQPILPGTTPIWGGEPVPGWQQCALNIGGECRPCLSHGITPLQSSKTAIQDGVNDLVSPTGTTNITAGLGWAWRVLMPEAPFTEAIPDPDYPRDQAIVLLTDGENVAGAGDAYKTVFGTGLAGRLAMDDRLRTLSDNVKGDGVIVYVVQFANAGGQLQTLLQGVASGPERPTTTTPPTQTPCARCSAR